MSTPLHATTYAALKPFITGATKFEPWMTTPSKRISLVAITLLTVVMSENSAGQELDIEAVLAPVIGLEARVPEHARSVQTLGAVRGGTGVVIDGAGLVLTIGYLIPGGKLGRAPAPRIGRQAGTRRCCGRGSGHRPRAGSIKGTARHNADALGDSVRVAHRRCSHRGELGA